ncbi:hypothetical protein L596_017561 [Steinernema carpocapsae]|uniref:SET domain-containing protein n=1 Tax=Steinernema carpocapsae TaxID=34508 RepID=A0A4U5N2A1_STECR|nr:hypothetical protein L596_017561 [Steinernema carpocapsae]
MSKNGLLPFFTAKRKIEKGEELVWNYFRGGYSGDISPSLQEKVKLWNKAEEEEIKDKDKIEHGDVLRRTRRRACQKRRIDYTLPQNSDSDEEQSPKPDSREARLLQKPMTYFTANGPLPKKAPIESKPSPISKKHQTSMTSFTANGPLPKKAPVHSKPSPSPIAKEQQTSMDFFMVDNQDTEEDEPEERHEEGTAAAQSRRSKETIRKEKELVETILGFHFWTSEDDDELKEMLDNATVWEAARGFFSRFGASTTSTPVRRLSGVQKPCVR